MKTKIIHFSETFHPEFEGWLSEYKKGVWISYIQSKEKGKGNFSKLLNELKAKYDWIKIPTPFADMKTIGIKKGFVLKQEYFQKSFNEMGEILYWEKVKS